MWGGNYLSNSSVIDFIFSYINFSATSEGAHHLYYLFSGDGFPALIPFWFIRNLIVAVLFSPAIYLVIKKSGKTFSGILILALLLYSINWGAELNYVKSIMWFSVGAWLSIYKIELSSAPDTILIPAIYLATIKK